LHGAKTSFFKAHLTAVDAASIFPKLDTDRNGKLDSDEFFFKARG